jgi:hypothetical protein
MSEASVTDRQQAGLHGLVRMCAVEREYLYPDHRWVMQTSSTFSERGNLLEQHHQNPDGSEWSILWRYDHHERLLEKEQRGPSAVEVFSYSYDAAGRLEHVAVRPEAGVERICESYRYDSAGQKMATVYPDPALRGANVGVEMESAFQISVEASSILTIFDEQDRPLKRVFYDPNGMVERRTLMRYDDAGRLAEEGEREADGSIRQDFRHVHRYDSEGRLMEKLIYHYAFGTHRKMFVYNEQGDTIEEEHHRTAGLIEHDGCVHDWNITYRYQYDDRGNWIERVTLTILPGVEPNVSMVERRMLNYY